MFIANKDVYILFIAALICAILAERLPHMGYPRIGEWFEILSFCVIGAILYALYKYMGNNDTSGGKKVTQSVK